MPGAYCWREWLWEDSFLRAMPCRVTKRGLHGLCPMSCASGYAADSLYQPLYPFVKVLEQVLADPQQKAKRQLIINIGLSVLGLIPLVGSIFDITKEVLRDMREYRRSQAGASSVPETQAMAESILGIAEQYPAVLLLDDSQWIDAASVEVLEYIVSSERSVPLAVVLAYEPSVVEAQNPLLASWLAQQERTSTLQVTLPLMTRTEIRELAFELLEGISLTLLSRNGFFTNREECQLWLLPICSISATIPLLPRMACYALRYSSGNIVLLPCSC